MYRLQTLLGGSRRLVGDNPRFLSGLSLLSGIQELLLNLGAELGDWLLLSGGLGQAPGARAARAGRGWWMPRKCWRWSRPAGRERRRVAGLMGNHQQCCKPSRTNPERLVDELVNPAKFGPKMMTEDG